jgi:hypothetical protein
MERIIEALVEIRTPLALAGGGLALVFAIFLQLLKRKQIGGQTTAMVVHYAFVLGLTALILGFAGYALAGFTPTEASLSGVVLDDHGNPVDEAMVSIGGMPEINDQTGANGNFRISVPAAKQVESYQIFARKLDAVGVSTVKDHFDDISIVLVQTAPDQKSEQRGPTEEQVRQNEASDAQRQAAADAEARRAAADEARQREIDEAERQAQAEADAERQKAAAQEEERRKAAEEAERQAVEEAKQKAEAEAEAQRLARGATVTLVNANSCAVGLAIQIGDKLFHPASNPMVLRSVPLGDQDYNVSGTVQCFGGWCYAYGSGSLHIEDGSTLAINAANNLPGKCEITFEEQ